jgi:phosphotransacetylase
MNLENMDIILQENISLKDKIILLEDENNKLSEKLKKYTSPDRNKKYYANHKDEIKQKIKEYNIQNNIIVSSEKRKEYNKRAYLKRKEKNNDK